MNYHILRSLLDKTYFEYRSHHDLGHVTPPPSQHEDYLPPCQAGAHMRRRPLGKFVPESSERHRMALFRAHRATIAQRYDLVARGIDRHAKSVYNRSSSNSIRTHNRHLTRGRRKQLTNSIYEGPESGTSQPGVTDLAGFA